MTTQDIIKGLEHKAALLVYEKNVALDNILILQGKIQAIEELITEVQVNEVYHPN